jgi:hypothetical protein
VDIFSAKKYEMFAPTSATAQEPIVTRVEMQVVDLNMGDVNEDGAIVSLMTEAGDTVDDLRVPMDEEYKGMREAIAANADGGGKDVYVTLVSAMGKRKIQPGFLLKYAPREWSAAHPLRARPPALPRARARARLCSQQPAARAGGS